MNSKWTDLAFKILSILVIPLLLWGVRLEVSKAVMNEKIEKLEFEVQATKANTNTLGRVEEKLNATNKRLDEIRADLHSSLPPL